MVFLIGMFSVAFRVKIVEASGTITIKDDGSIDPSDAPINTTDKVTYYFTSNISDKIVIQRDNIVVDGANYALQGTGSGWGITLESTYNVTIKNTKIIQFYDGIFLIESSNNTLLGNNITESDSCGIYLHSSFYNNVSGNYITNSSYGGIYVRNSSNNIISGNNIGPNNGGLFLYDSSNDNKIFHNNFINNEVVQAISGNCLNIWDDDYPSGGNYWSDYAGVDANMDGIGDSSYEVEGWDSTNIDHYPLMGMFSDFPVTLEEETYHVTTVCNSTISAFEFDQVNKIIRFNVTGEEGIGFCRVSIPHALVEPPYNVTVDGYSPLYANYILYDNGTHTWIYFTYQHSTHEVEIMPEFPTWTPIILILTVLTIAVTIHKRRPLKTPTH
jgi:parallel beta-helix repeat protein